MAVPEDAASRYLLGLVGDADCIRVRRADMVSVARAREAHAQAVIAAWSAARVPAGDSVLLESRRSRLLRGLRAAARALRGARLRPAP